MKSKSRLLLIAYTLSGVAALVYELGWMRELSTMLGATAYASGTMLGAYMCGLGLGTLVGTWRAARTSRPLIDAAFAELFVALFSIAAFAGIRFLPGLYFDWMHGAGTANGFLTLQFFVCFLVMLLPTFAAGLTYPLIMKGIGKGDHLGAAAGRLYAVNTGGAILGSLLATFAFLPTIGVKGSLIVAAALSVAASVLLRALAGKGVNIVTFFKKPVMIALAVVAIVGVSIIPARSGSPLGLGQAFYYRDTDSFTELANKRKTLFDKEGIYSRVQVTQNPDGTKTLANGALDEGTDNKYDRVTTTMLATVPSMSVESTKNAFVVGLGTGYTSQTYTELGFKHVVTAEINPDVLPAAEYFTGKHSEKAAGATASSTTAGGSWDIVVDDARAHLLTNSETYDCISSEPSWPWSSGVAALFTTQFMNAAKSRLAPDGAYCQWLPNYLLEPADVAMMYKTMSSVYGRVDMWSINFPDSTSGELLLIGYKNPDKAPSQAVIKERLDALIVKDAKQFDNPYITKDCITPYAAATEVQKQAALASTPLNTDDHSSLEYRVFWNYLKLAFDQTPVWGSGGSVLEQ